MLVNRIACMALGVLAFAGTGFAAELMPGFAKAPFFGEQTRDSITALGVHIHVNAPQQMNPAKTTTVVFYATPNGNTIAQTLGCKMVAGLDWHYDIQHIAAQTRVLRDVTPDQNIVLACVQPEERSWPAWRAKHSDNATLIRSMVEDTIKGLPGKSISVALTGHSGGGSMIFGFLNSSDEIPSYVKRIAWLDANYAYSDDEKHGDKLVKWLRGDKFRTLVVLCYDDRNITLNGKPVVGPTGGTYRATGRMRDRFGKDIKLDHTESGDVDRYTGLDGRVTFIVHRNPQNKILHTALVGEMNGYLEAMTQNTPAHGKWGAFGAPRAYTKWIQPAIMPAKTSTTESSIKPKSAAKSDALTLMASGITASAAGTGGSVICQKLLTATTTDREAAILAETKAGNVPAFLKNFITVRIDGADAKGVQHTASYEVAPDYFAIGTDADFVRMPLTPMTAQPIADLFKCTLPTRKMVDQIYTAAAVKVAPQPLTENREALATFIQHNQIIEGQRAGKTLGLLVAGIKKDVCITNLLQQQTDRVAIYGWHQLSGVPIQPLTTVHVNWYVDYSHGIRLVKRQMIVDGQPRDLWDILKDPDLYLLVSDEGTIAVPHYPTRQYVDLSLAP